MVYFDRKKKGCDSFARSELAYLKIFENRLYAKLKAIKKN
jgi:hypothetical protein